jgi:hypothetical protein
VGVREYTGREPMKEIHWLQTAHRGELMVREFDYNMQLTVCVLLSVNGIDPWDEYELDECCAVARTVCESLAEAGALVKFYTNAQLKRKLIGQIWKCEVSSGNMSGLLEGLGRAASYDSGTLDTLLEFALRDSSFDSAYILIVPKIEERGNEAANRLRHRTSQDVMVVEVVTDTQKMEGA